MNVAILWLSEDVCQLYFFLKSQVHFRINLTMTTPLLSPQSGHDFRLKCEKPLQLYKWVFPVDLPQNTLALVDAYSVYGPHLPAIDMRCRWAAAVVAGRCPLPKQDVMRADQVKQYKHIEDVYDAKFRVRSVLFLIHAYLSAETFRYFHARHPFWYSVGCNALQFPGVVLYSMFSSTLNLVV